MPGAPAHCLPLPMRIQPVFVAPLDSRAAPPPPTLRQSTQSSLLASSPCRLSHFPFGADSLSSYSPSRASSRGRSDNIDRNDFWRVPVLHKHGLSRALDFL
jgi:hypothetical protein